MFSFKLWLCTTNTFFKIVFNFEKFYITAVALFRQCGQALRKRRQKREYRDLLSWVQDNEETDDPAEKDPILLAKLEENKLIANVKEEEILERYAFDTGADYFIHNQS